MTLSVAIVTAVCNVSNRLSLARWTLTITTKKVDCADYLLHVGVMFYGSSYRLHLTFIKVDGVMDGHF